MLEAGTTATTTTSRPPASPAAPTAAAATRIDLHQHLLPPAFLDALRSRTVVPRLIDEWTLLTEGSRPTP
ncbi:hypothetical protein GCM10025867_40750 [Frondihabitans sucicola]|uniref:Amidohydrolase n=1 Tax=Frondihabitans sucicola TaxID=1268041 RepID=A0ABN6Y417_9MICO|nr:hypothetical protein [Frondihabitans sucicola]BDZ51834.1 hypothetical protein GCM10025867_40750 [Frondihabitans sucicola]